MPILTRAYMRYGAVALISWSAVGCGGLSSSKDDLSNAPTASEQKVLAWIATRDRSVITPENPDRFDVDAWIAEGRAIPHLESTLLGMMRDAEQRGDDAQLYELLIAHWIAKSATSESLADMIKLTDHSDFSIQGMAIMILGDIGSEEAVQELSDESIHNGHINCRVWALEALMKINPPTLRGTLQYRLEQMQVELNILKTMLEKVENDSTVKDTSRDGADDQDATPAL